MNIHTSNDLILSEGRFALVNDLSVCIGEILLQEYIRLEKSLLTIQGEYFCFNSGGSLDLSHTNMISKYSCIFPKRTIIQSSRCEVLDFANKQNISDSHFEFLLKYIAYKPLITSGIAYFAPMTLSEKNQESDPLYNRENVAHLLKLGQMENEEEILSCLHIALPWLYEVSINDYLDIVKEYPLEFENYNLYLQKIAMATHGKIELTQQLAKEIMEISLNIEIALQKKKSELKTRGVVSFIGVCLTCIPVFVPEISQYFNPEILSTLLGTGTIKELIGTAVDINAVRSVYKDNPFWIISKWKSST